jgi:hypothetical protein
MDAFINNTSANVEDTYGLEYAIFDKLGAAAVAQGGTVHEDRIEGDHAIHGRNWRVDLVGDVLVIALRRNLPEAIGTPLLRELDRLLAA